MLLAYASNLNDMLLPNHNDRKGREEKATAQSTQAFPVYAYTQERPGIHPGNPDLTIVDSYAHDSSIRTGFFLIS